MPKYIDKTLRECFHPKVGKPNLRKVPVNAERVKQHIDMHGENIKENRVLIHDLTLEETS